MPSAGWAIHNDRCWRMLPFRCRALNDSNQPEAATRSYKRGVRMYIEASAFCTS